MWSLQETLFYNIYEVRSKGIQNKVVFTKTEIDIEGNVHFLQNIPNGISFHKSEHF